MRPCPTLLALPHHTDARGTLIHAHADREIPFAIARCFTITGMPPDITRGGHAHRRARQALQCLAGSFRIVTEGTQGTTTWTLSSPTQFLSIPPLHWVTFAALDTGAILHTYADQPYDEAEYIRERAVFDRLLDDARSAP